MYAFILSLAWKKRWAWKSGIQCSELIVMIE